MPFTKRLVLRSLRDERGTSHRSVELRRGCLVVVGHDLGGIYDEYEFERKLSREETARLCELLEVDPADLLTEVEQRFGDTPPLEAFLREHGLEGTFWNRIG
jgi:hypothetical protein